MKTAGYLVLITAGFFKKGFCDVAKVVVTIQKLI
jgi:hypothetical protein